MSSYRAEDLLPASPTALSRDAACESLARGGGDGVTFDVLADQAGSNTLTVKLLACVYVAATFPRRPEATTIVSGTGMAAPAYS